MRTLVVGGSVIGLVQIAAVLLCWRLGAMRSRAEPFAEEPGPSVWDALDRHLAEDEAIAVAAQSNADHFALWEAELADVAGIARHLRRMERWSR